MSSPSIAAWSVGEARWMRTAARKEEGQRDVSELQRTEQVRQGERNEQCWLLAKEDENRGRSARVTSIKQEGGEDEQVVVSRELLGAGWMGAREGLLVRVEGADVPGGKEQNDASKVSTRIDIFLPLSLELTS